MNELFQRLKELDPGRFEELCFQIWSEKLPGAGLKHVEGKAGDKGTDQFAGTLSRKPALWQCKFFKDGMRDVQKKQVKKSLSSALRHFTPSVWTLCVPVNLDINAHAWLQKLAAQNPKIKIESFDASLIVKELIFRPQIRESFFPAAVIDIRGIKELLLGTGNYSDEQLGVAADESVEQYVERLRQKEPRYDYQVSYLSGTTGVTTFAAREQALPPNTVFSSWKGNRRLDVVVRDVEAVRKDPPRVTLAVSQGGSQKIQHAMISGESVTLGEGELLNFASSFDYLLSAEERAQPHEISLTPHTPKIKASFRMSCTSGMERLTYDLVEFEMIKKAIEPGVLGVELTSISTHIPFRLRLQFGFDLKTLTFEVETSFAGHSVIEVDKFFNAMRILRVGGDLELFDLKLSRSLGIMKVNLSPPSKERDAFERLIRELSEVSKAFEQSLLVPEVLKPKDIESLPFLLEVLRRGEISGAEVGNLTAKLVRNEEPPDALLQSMAGEFMVGLENDQYPPQYILGAKITIGPWRLFIEKATLRDLERVRREYALLKSGDTIDVTFDHGGSVRQIFPRFYKTDSPPPRSDANGDEKT